MQIPITPKKPFAPLNRLARQRIWRSLRTGLPDLPLALVALWLLTCLLLPLFLNA